MDIIYPYCDIYYNYYLILILKKIFNQNLLRALIDNYWSILTLQKQ